MGKLKTTLKKLSHRELTSKTNPFVYSPTETSCSPTPASHFIRTLHTIIFLFLALFFLSNTAAASVLFLAQDFDQDGYIGNSDLNFVRSNFGILSIESIENDLDGDGLIGTYELNAVRSAWGQSITEISAPAELTNEQEEKDVYCYVTNLGGNSYYCCDGEIYNKNSAFRGPTLRECVSIIIAPDDETANNYQDKVDMTVIGNLMFNTVSQVIDWEEPRAISIDELCELWFEHMDDPWFKPLPQNIVAYCETGDDSYLE